MGGRVVGLGDQVGAFGEDFTALDDDRRERTTALGDVLAARSIVRWAKSMPILRPASLAITS
jgi:hypothetical protein